MLKIDTHTHVFCWGENPEDGYLSERTRRGLITRLVLWSTGLKREAGDTISDKIRSRLLRHLQTSVLDYCVVYAQDGCYHENGSADHDNTHVFVSNDYVLRLAGEQPKIIPCCSINPIRRDALQELSRVREAGCRVVKIHTAIQGVDPARAEFAEFYKLAADIGITLIFHTGYEHSAMVVSQQFTDPKRLQRVLEFGQPVIAAHCGTCAFFDREDYYPKFIDMMNRYDNLYGDTAIMASLIRWSSLRRLAREPQSIRDRILHGSDYPFPPARLPYLLRTGLFPKERKNPLDMDLRIKESFQFSDDYAGRIAGILGIEQSIE